MIPRNNYVYTIKCDVTGFPTAGCGALPVT